MSARLSPVSCMVSNAPEEEHSTTRLQVRLQGSPVNVCCMCACPLVSAHHLRRASKVLQLLCAWQHLCRDTVGTHVVHALVMQARIAALDRSLGDAGGAAASTEEAMRAAACALRRERLAGEERARRVAKLERELAAAHARVRPM